MPVAKNPNAREYFVYAFAAHGRTFYVGMGRSARASDRVRYVGYLMRREARGLPVKWSTSSRVIADLLRRQIQPDLTILASGLTRPEALAREVVEIARLRAGGSVLANRVHNDGSAISFSQVMTALLQSNGDA